MILVFFFFFKEHQQFDSVGFFLIANWLFFLLTKLKQTKKKFVIQTIQQCISEHLKRKQIKRLILKIGGDQ